MSDEESSRSEESAAPGKRPRVRRSRRGGRGRGRARKPLATAAEPEGPETAPESPESAAAEERIETAEPGAEEMPMADSPIEEARHEAGDELGREEPEGAEELPARAESEVGESTSLQRAPVRHDFRPASPMAIAEAIGEVNQIITSLKQVLDQMEEVLETLELAEVQKSADEREIQSLRNALRQFERRGGGGEPRHEHGSHSQSQQRHDPRRGRHR